MSLVIPQTEFVSRKINEYKPGWFTVTVGVNDEKFGAKLTTGVGVIPLVKYCQDIVFAAFDCVPFK